MRYLEQHPRANFEHDDGSDGEFGIGGGINPLEALFRQIAGGAWFGDDGFDDDDDEWETEDEWETDGGEEEEHGDDGDDSGPRITEIIDDGDQEDTAA